MIFINNMNKSFNNKILFENFNLEVKAGEFIGIYGKSGKGKTTLLNIIGMLENPDSGEIKLLGRKQILIRKTRLIKK